MMIVLIINKKTKDVKEIRNLNRIKRFAYCFIEIEYINPETMKKAYIIVDTEEYTVIIKQKGEKK